MNALGAFTPELQGHIDMADVDVLGDLDLEWGGFEGPKPFAGTESLGIEDARRNYDEVEEDDELDDEELDDEDFDDDFDEEEEDFDFDEEDEDFDEDDDFDLEEDDDFDDEEEEV